MDIIHKICGKTTIHPETMAWLLVEFLLLGFILYFVIFAIRNHKNWIGRILFSVISFGAFIVLSIILLIVFTVFLEKTVWMGKYFDLNAAIKNTCSLDPQKKNCPRSIDELISIEPQKFIPLTKNAHLTIYDFHPDEGRYTLIVREDDYNAIIFDPRLEKVTEWKIDSVAYGVSKCINKYSIIDPPDIPGPWDNIK